MTDRQLTCCLLLLAGKCGTHLTVRWYCGSSSCTTCIHSELAHSTEDCCRNRISLQASRNGGEERRLDHVCRQGFEYVHTHRSIQSYSATHGGFNTGPTECAAAPVWWCSQLLHHLQDLIRRAVGLPIASLQCTSISHTKSRSHTPCCRAQATPCWVIANSCACAERLAERLAHLEDEAWRVDNSQVGAVSIPVQWTGSARSCCCARSRTVPNY